MAETTARAERETLGRGRLPWALAAPMQVLPLAPLHAVSTAVMQIILLRNSGIIERLGAHAWKKFVIDPVDCPFVYVLEPRPDHPKLLLQRSLGMEPCDARIAAPLALLLGLFDGSLDGDALFFSRDIVVEGDIAAILALRNAIENADLDPGRLLGLPQPLAPLATVGMQHLASRLRQILAAPPMPATAATSP